MHGLTEILMVALLRHLIQMEWILLLVSWRELHIISVAGGVPLFLRLMI